MDPGARRRAGEARARREGRRRRLRARRLDGHHGRGVPELASSSGSTTTTPRSNARARRPRQAGVADRITFEVASAKDYPGGGYDLVCVFDCLHDMGDPVGALGARARDARADGTWMIVEPFANDRVEDNLNPVGRVFYGASTMICTPASLAQEVGLALGRAGGRGATERGRSSRAASRACAARPRRRST